MRFHIFVFVILALVAGACAPSLEPLPTQPAPTQVPPSPVPLTDIPTLAPVSLAGPQVGSSMTWIDNSVLMYVPAGDFTMGPGASGAPQRTVSLDSYWIYKTEVTQGMYAYCVAAGACAPPAQGSIVQEYQNPFLREFPDGGRNLGYGLQLLRLGRWQPADRSPVGEGCAGRFRFPISLGRVTDPIVVLATSAAVSGGLTEATAFPGSASQYGVLDMSGNVFEWVNDYYAETFDSSAPAQNPTGPESGEFRTVRGSSFESPASQAAITVRRPAANAYTSGDLGFRCVVQQPQPLAPMCQLPSFLPASEVPADSCQTPDAKVAVDYCENKRPFTQVELSPGSTWSVQTVDTTCTEATVNGIRQLTCTGSDSVIGQVSVCNPACQVAEPDLSQMNPVCASGYTLDPSTGNCLYSPVSRQPEFGRLPGGLCNGRARWAEHLYAWPGQQRRLPGRHLFR